MKPWREYTERVLNAIPEKERCEAARAYAEFQGFREWLSVNGIRADNVSTAADLMLALKGC